MTTIHGRLDEVFDLENKRMPLPVKLADLVEQLSIVSDDIAVYLNKRTGEFVPLSLDDILGFEDEDDFAAAEDPDEPDWLEDQPEWVKEEQRTRREILNSADYLPLPDKFDIHDWQIMKDFCNSVKDARLREQLLGLIRGREAFGRFNASIKSLGIEQAWHQFHNRALGQIAIEWLELYEIPFEISDSQLPIANAALANATRGDQEVRPPATVRGGSRSMDEDQTKKTKKVAHQQKASPAKVDNAGRQEKTSETDEIKVFISNRNSHCGECDQDLGKKAWITLEREKGALCLACADLDELVFLPAGDAALTRRSKKYSNLSAVVLKFSKARGRYERLGLLVEEAALEQAEAECLGDSEVRERRNERARERRAEFDEQYVREFAKQIRTLFPNCPPAREQVIAEHACLKYSGRVGRSAAAKEFDDQMITLAVMAHLRHRETNYDQLLGQGSLRHDARAVVRDRIEEIAEKWRG
jgi:hypothetical protein